MCVSVSLFASLYSCVILSVYLCVFVSVHQSVHQSVPALQSPDPSHSWFFLPRRASQVQHSDEVDSVAGTNLLITYVTSDVCTLLCSCSQCVVWHGLLFRSVDDTSDGSHPLCDRDWSCRPLTVPTCRPLTVPTCRPLTVPTCRPLTAPTSRSSQSLPARRRTSRRLIFSLLATSSPRRVCIVCLSVVASSIPL